MTRRMAALRTRLDATSEAGVSLVELIVVMFVTGIVLTIVGSMFVNVAAVTTTANGVNNRNAIAANIMNSMAKAISTASNNAVSTSDTPDPAIVSGTPTALTVITYIDTSPTNPTPSKVSYRVDSAGQVFEDRVAGTLSGSYYVFTSSTVTRQLGGPVVSSGMFVYLDKSGAVVTPTAGVLSPTQRNIVASIRVTVTIANSTSTGVSDPVQIINTINMPNVLLTGSDS